MQQMDELLDVINDEDVVIDQQMRSTVHQLGLQHRGVHVLLFTPEGKMLVQKRSADRAACPSSLDCSVSEHVKAGEGYLDAALRGMKEELGLEAIDIQPLAKIMMIYGPNDNEISMIYQGTIKDVQITFDPIEIDEVRYHNVNEIQDMIKNRGVAFCGWFIEIVNWYTRETNHLTVLTTY
jgi:isopentenyldiphosphate isomerase